MSTKRSRVRAFRLLILALLLTPLAFAQADRGTLTGTVTTSKAR